MDLHDQNYKRLRYCCYADDFVLGIIGTKDEAEEIMSAVKTFIEDDLRLSISEEKTTISTGKKGVEFPGYRISVYRDEKNDTNQNQRKIPRNRKTLVICTECHHLLHAGKLPDKRYKEKS